MKKFISCGFIILISICNWSLVNAQTVTLPAASSAAEVQQQIGLTKITVHYSRPNVIDTQGNDRTGKIWGSLVPYGFNVDPFGAGNPSPWRAGANENTTITFSDDVEIEGKSLAAGIYGLHIAVSQNNTAIVVFSKNYKSWGSFFYDEKEDALRVEIKTQEVPMTKILTYTFIDYTSTSTTLALDWEKKRFPVKIDIDVPAIVVANMRNELRNTAGFSWQGYMNAAQYCLNKKINNTEALTWIDQSIRMNKNAQNSMVKAQLLLQNGEVAKSNEIINDAIKTADVVQLNAIGYQLIAAGNLDKAIEIFQENVKRNPKDANVHDSLGEAYKMKGEKELAIKSFKKSLSLNPPDNVKSNSIKNLKELGVEN
jgi:hypothetical protein